MTIERESRRSDVYLGDGSSTALPFGFKVFLPTEIAVVLNENGVERTLSHGHGCTVSLNAEQDVQPGGTVRLDTPLPTGSKAVVLSNVRPLQQVDLTNQGGFYPDVLNALHDRLTILIQQLMELQARTPQVPATDSIAGKELGRQIVELSRSLPEALRLLTSDEFKKLLKLIKTNPSLGGVELSSAVNSVREDVAATSKAVKIAYDKAVDAEATAASAEGAVSNVNGELATKLDTSVFNEFKGKAATKEELEERVGDLASRMFTGQLAETGYIKFHNNLIFQWIRINKAIGSYAGAYQFPIAFPNKCFGAICGDAWSGTANGYITSVGVESNNSFRLMENRFVDVARGNTAQLLVFAIGY